MENLLLTIENWAQLHSHLIDLINVFINFFVAIGTIGAVIIALWLSYNQHRPRLQSVAYIKSIAPNAFESICKNFLNSYDDNNVNLATGIDSEKKHVTIEITNIGTTPVFINQFGFNIKFNFVRPYILYPIQPYYSKLDSGIKIPINKKEMILFNEEETFLKILTEWCDSPKHGLFFKLFRKLMLKAGCFDLWIQTIDGKRHKVKINKDLKEEMVKI